MNEHSWLAGADCENCPLLTERTGGPCRPSHPPGASVLVVEQEPGALEAKLGGVFTGMTGAWLDRTLAAAGENPLNYAKTAGILCVPPKGSVAVYEKLLAGRNKKRMREGLAPLLPPTRCCLPRLEAEAARYDFIIPMGTSAAKALIPGMRGGINKARGMLHETADGKKMLPTLAPFIVQKEPKWQEIVEEDFRRARRWFSDSLRGADPTMIYRPEPEQLREILKSYHYEWRGYKVHAWDVETDSKYAMRAGCRCVGIGTPDWAVVVPLDPIDPRSSSYSGPDGQVIPFYSLEQLEQVKAILRGWATDPGIVKIGQNSGVYDRLVFESVLGVTPAPILDTILMHRSVQPDHRHSLGFITSHFLDVPNWKGEHTATKPRDDRELWKYNGLDTCYTARLIEPLFSRLEERGQVGVMHLDLHSQDACVEMHRNGMLIDQENRDEQDVHLFGLAQRWTQRVRTTLQRSGLDVSAIVKRSAKEDQRARERGLSVSEEEEEWRMPTGEEMHLDMAAFNPMSHPQIRAVLFDEWELPLPTNMKEKDLYTGSGEVSTGDAVLRGLLMLHLTPEQRHFIFALRMARRWAKLWGTYIRPLRPWTGDEKLDRGCALWPDGRLHPNWSCHTPITGRFACSEKNVMNIPGVIKPMFISRPGYVLVGSDMDQLELRIAASLWRAEKYLEAFDRGLDPHQMTMESVFGLKKIMGFQGAPTKFGTKTFEKKSEFEAMRKLAKAIQYAGQYGATTETVYRLVTSAEDKKTGKMVFADLTLLEVAAMHENWMRGCPEFQSGWDGEMAMVKAQGYLVEPVTGRRRDYLDGGKNLSEVVNFRIQASAAGVMNKLFVPVRKRLPGVWNNQCHDALTCEVPHADAKRAEQIMIEEMTVKDPAFPDVTLTCDPAIAWPEEDEKGKGKSRWSAT